MTMHVAITNSRRTNKAGVDDLSNVTSLESLEDRFRGDEQGLFEDASGVLAEKAGSVIGFLRGGDDHQRIR